MVSSHELDTPITRASLLDMTDEQIDALLERMRDERMRLYQQYKAAEDAKREKRRTGVLAALEHECNMFVKELARVDTALAKLQARAHKINTRRVEADLL